MMSTYRQKISPDYSWAHWSDDQLLNTRLCDLKLTLHNTKIEEYIQCLYKELDEKNIFFHPPCYLADEWFVPQKGTMIGIPFYLSHPRLSQLEEKMILEIEGGKKESFMKLIRHEAGHAIYYAFTLHRKQNIKKIFGKPSASTPDTYRPKPYSRGYVRHLDNWYAQCDPDEDFAETFAIWLTPHSNWRNQYKGWKALKKLECMQKIMDEISNKKPFFNSREKICSIQTLKLKLSTHYRRKRKFYEQDYPEFHDPDLKKIFSDNPLFRFNEPAFVFMKKNRKMITDIVTQWTGEKKYNVNSLLKNLIERCRILTLKVHKSEMESLLEVTACLASMISNYLLTGKFKRSI